MRLLIDSHAFLWWSGALPALGAAARGAIADPTNEVLLSVAALWELTVKTSSGRLRLPADLETMVASQGVPDPLNQVPAFTAPCRFAPGSSRSV